MSHCKLVENAAIRGCRVAERLPVYAAYPIPGGRLLPNSVLIVHIYTLPAKYSTLVGSTVLNLRSLQLSIDQGSFGRRVYPKPRLS